MKLQFTSDPGHGWLHVKRAVAKQIMGKKFNQLTFFSYQRGQTIYLEEDQDANLFLECAKEKNIDIEISPKYTERYSQIRSYEPLNVNLVAV